MLIFIGNSASGKTFITNSLKQYGYNKVVTYTTRAIRPDEIDGVDYNFVSVKNFEDLVVANFFFEYSNYAGNYYGSHFDTQDIESNKAYIILDISGARELKKVFGDKIKVIGIWTPKTVCEERLAARPKVTKADIEKRLAAFYSLSELKEVSDIIVSGMENPDVIRLMIEDM